MSSNKNNQSDKHQDRRLFTLACGAIVSPNTIYTAAACPKRNGDPRVLQCSCLWYKLDPQLKPRDALCFKKNPQFKMSQQNIVFEF